MQIIKRFRDKMYLEVCFNLPMKAVYEKCLAETDTERIKQINSIFIAGEVEAAYYNGLNCREQKIYDDNYIEKMKRGLV